MASRLWRPALLVLLAFGFCPGNSALAARDVLTTGGAQDTAAAAAAAATPPADSATTVASWVAVLVAAAFSVSVVSTVAVGCLGCMPRQRRKKANVPAHSQAPPGLATPTRQSQQQQQASQQQQQKAAAGGPGGLSVWTPSRAASQASRAQGAGAEVAGSAPQDSSELSPKRAGSISLASQLRLQHHSIAGLDILGLLGVGAAGRTYKGRWAGENVSVKILEHKVRSGDEQSLAREPVLCSTLNHPCIVTTYKISTVRLTVSEALLPRPSPLGEGYAGQQGDEAGAAAEAAEDEESALGMAALALLAPQQTQHRISIDAGSTGAQGVRYLDAQRRSDTPPNRAELLLEVQLNRHPATRAAAAAAGQAEPDTPWVQHAPACTDVDVVVSGGGGGDGGGNGGGMAAAGPAAAQEAAAATPTRGQGQAGLHTPDFGKSLSPAGEAAGSPPTPPQHTNGHSNSSESSMGGCGSIGRVSHSSSRSSFTPTVLPSCSDRPSFESNPEAPGSSDEQQRATVQCAASTPGSSGSSRVEITLAEPLKIGIYEVWMIQEFCDKVGLDECIRKRKLIRHRDGTPYVRHIYHVLLDVAEGMRYLHDQGMIHQDLRAENVLLQTDASSRRGWRAKVADFGLHNLLDKAYAHQRQRKSLAYTAPEMLKWAAYTKPGDVFVFGHLMWEVWECRRVYEGRSSKEILQAVISQDLQLPAPTGCPGRYIHLLNSCWEANPANRPSFGMILRELREQLKELIRADEMSGVTRTDRAY